MYLIKRSQLFRELKKAKPWVVFLQETNFKNHHIPTLPNNYLTKMYQSTNALAKTKGVSILLSKDANISIMDHLIDPEGRYMFLKGSWAGKNPLAIVYFPNKVHITFCQHLLD